MKWDRDHQSNDVIDRRGESGGGGGGMLGPLMWIGSRFGIVGMLVVAGLYFGAQFLFGGDRVSATSNPRARSSVASDERVAFVHFVLDDIQSVWGQEFPKLGKRYAPAKLVLFTDRTRSGCGIGAAEMGPFYCPADNRVYVDLGFFEELEQRFGAPGDFAQAYVIAHEVGHHVQTLLGLDRAKRAAGRNAEGAEGASVRLELQADCLAGIWAHSAQQRKFVGKDGTAAPLLDPGDIEEGLAAAASVGDDRIQRQSGGSVHPESWTHGSAEQRMRWFRRGLETGEMAACDTSNAASL
ncbi:neutral zinc metallopeptidase [Polyangium aurulentum]|uniref:KPN_02809 family neutral zinc metallopeptidase n=1 Tax=Polyangium aurulentum TaxID=2567896 RepID=UPI0010ADA8A7|nr:neutral zinc metallopeptidase [Polyangium aurulentum]UQA56474.1 neutral zinc metallopeptidase [Polyangium aurulentum]